MSHFTVLVSADDEADLFEKLIPYYEYGCSEQRDNELQRRGLLEFRVTHKAGEFEQDARAIFNDLDGTEDYYQDYADFIANGDYTGLFQSWDGGDLNPENGDWGYWRNPNKKWDWYSIGGRWTGLLHLKPGAIGDNGEGGAFNSVNTDDQRADIALSGDVDWQSILDEQIQDKRVQYHAYRRCLEEVQEIDLTQYLPRAQEKYLDNQYCREAYKSASDYAISLAADAVAHRKGVHFWDTFQESADKFYLTDDEYTAKFSGKALTYAFVDLEGNWNQRGQMGWFGMDDKAKATQNYDVAFWHFVELLPDDQKVYVVDCHI